ncbi:MAG: hypothetical protein HAW60_03755 [Bdellovibrionales bacterium]|nr:hypothetical protein [Bdellovibrionales bacterium]
MSNKNNIIDFQDKVNKLKDISNPTLKVEDKSSSKKESEKIVSFPGPKLTSIQKALNADEKFKSILGGRVISTLLGMFVLTLAAQSMWFSSADNKNNRGLASTISRSLASIETYLNGSKRGVASVAKLPNTIESFNFGTLNGWYTLKTDGNFIASFSSNGKAIRVSSAPRFLKKHKNLWKLKFSSLNLIYSNKNKKIYSLLDKKKNILGKVIIYLNWKGNLQSLKFDKNRL